MSRVMLVTAMMVAAGLAGCATAPNAPEALRPPAGQELVLALQADGVQIYDCAAAAKGGVLLRLPSRPNRKSWRKSRTRPGKSKPS